jgi:hypothetical protein
LPDEFGVVALLGDAAKAERLQFEAHVSKTERLIRRQRLSP